MRLRRLEIQAVGPFAGRHVVDLEVLSASGLFLLEGPTGAGKSTLIDAIVFALYGKVASEATSDDRVRSAFAADDVETVVDLVFEVPGGVYRVRRTPAHTRAKRRGEGTTTAPATGRLWRLSPDDDLSGSLDALGVPLSNRLDEIGAEITRIVGLDRAQFVQTVVLPQGEFARFLKANPEDRRGLLQRIFGTGVYERLQERLVALRQEASRAVDEARGGLDAALARFAGAARVESVEAPLEEVSALVRAQVAALVEESDALGARGAVATSAAAAARGRLDDAMRLDAVHRRRDALLSEQRALAAGRDSHEVGVARLERARAAREVQGVLAGLDEARTAWVAATKDLAARRDGAPDDLAAVVPDVASAADPAVPSPVAPGDLTSSAEPGPSSSTLASGSRVRDGRDRLEAARRDATETAATLVRAVRLEAGLTAQRQGVRTAAAGLEDLAREVVTHREWLAGRPAQRTELVTHLDAARSAAARVPAATVAHDEAVRLAGLLRDREAMDAPLARASSRVIAARRVADEALAHEVDLRQRRLDGWAGQLAADLHDGDPCPVCGSADHPGPAVRDTDPVDQAAIDAAAQARADAESALLACSKDLATLTEREAGLAAALGGASARQIADDLERTGLALTECTTAAAPLLTLETAVEQFDSATAARQEQLTAAQVAAAEAESTLEALRAALAEAEVEVVAAHDGYPTVVAREQALRERAATAADLLDALTACRAAALDLTRRAAQAATTVAECGFAGEAEAREALLPALVLAELERAVSAYATAVARVEAALAEPELAELAPLADDALDSARSAEQSARAQADDLRARCASAAQVAASAADAAESVIAAAATLTDRLEAQRPVARMAALASGTGADNARSLSLATYVLVRRFEDVVAAANARLVTMSDGRYELVRSDEKEDVRTRSTGLAMRVLDHRTERPRDPRTLSGGETFYVSLCLALGLADVVTAEAGGVELGTLFVDEGFGSLDPRVLDQVLAELGRLRAGGRAVGVVSHVDTLKQAIADRIEVRPQADGSSTLTVRAG